MTAENTKILSWNVGYLLGYDGSFLDYLLNSYRAVLGDSNRESKAIEDISRRIIDEQPEVVCLQEVDTGSFRTSTDNQIRRLCSRVNEEIGGYNAYFKEKYGSGSAFRALPIMKNLGNGVLYRGDKEIRTHRIDAVSKNLVHEVKMEEDTSLFSVHAPLRQSERYRYLEGLSDLIGEKDNVIVCGDFNCSEEMEKVKEIASRNDLEISNPGATFPASEPKKNFDLLLSSEGVDVESCGRLESDVSDHLPIEAEIRLS